MRLQPSYLPPIYSFVLETVWARFADDLVLRVRATRTADCADKQLPGQSFLLCPLLCTSDYIERDVAIRTEVSETNNWTKVSPVLWYRSVPRDGILLKPFLIPAMALNSRTFQPACN